MRAEKPTNFSRAAVVVLFLAAIRVALAAHSGPLRLVLTEDKRPARSVRNLISIELKGAGIDR